MTQYYTIVAGDSLWRIAQKFNTTVDALVQLNGFSSSSVTIHPGQRIIVGHSGTTPSTPTPSPSAQGNLDKLVGWFRERIGKTTYSDTARFGPNSYDCSSSLYFAMIHAGFLPQGTQIGWTGTLFQLEGSLLIPIKREEARFGDIFISGAKPDGSHTGVFVSNTHIVHMVSEEHGMKETPFVGWYGETPVYYYRLKNGSRTTQTPPPQPTPTPSAPATSMAANAKKIWDYLTQRGWTKQAVAAVLGNMETESGIQADIDAQNGDGGYGLVQWTPGSKLINWARERGLNHKTIETQLARIEYEVANELQFLYATMTFKQFIKSTQSPESLAEIFVRAYERPSEAGLKLAQRQQQARAWYNLFAQTQPTPQPATPTRPTTSEIVERTYKESGTFTANRALSIRNEPKQSAPVAATLEIGESVTYDSVYLTNQYVYISYISYSGVRRYLAIRTYTNGQRGQMWGTIV
ncbi:MAG: phage tail tip lysozyme [Aerococcaceae bacterium]|nr:phage tail tip lysozyme [Aerococcaceae bacterium]